ncbi:hypothetical protein ON010_g3187 [Phytophthora cinnamomi]|nr:hypothetical protein ON010_g3187 [Phytophthora cinnamomi]
MTSTIVGKTAKSVTAVEIIADFPKANVATNGHLQNITFFCQDVMNLEAEPNSFDVIFSNWIFMYLGDGEVKELAKKAIKWLRPGGKLLFRESCFRQYGDIKRNSNPTYYRHPSFYVGVFGSVVSKKENGELGYFNLDSSGSIASTARLRGITGKYSSATPRLPSEAQVATTKLLPRSKRSLTSTSTSTRVSPATRKYSARDTSAPAARPPPPSGVLGPSFDVVYSRDTILHVEDKQALFAKFFRWLKPGGLVLISDYCQGEQESTNIFKAYVAGRGYHLLSPAQYGKVLESVGFTSVVAEDRTKQFVEVLNEELARMLTQKHGFVAETSEADFKYIRRRRRMVDYRLLVFSIC